MGPPPNLMARVEAALHLIFDGALLDIIEDTGGLGLCVDASQELSQHLPTAHVAWIDLLRREVILPEDLAGVLLPEEYPAVDYPRNEHCVVLWAGWFIDLTARQYDESLPFPFYWQLPKD